MRFYADGEGVTFCALGQVLKDDCLNQLSAGHRKTAFALKLNVLWLIEKYGLERIGFLTLTFARHVVAYKEGQKALHSLMTGVLKQRGC